MLLLHTYPMSQITPKGVRNKLLKCGVLGMMYSPVTLNRLWSRHQGHGRSHLFHQKDLGP